jgi:hypothetical protein
VDRNKKGSVSVNAIWNLNWLFCIVSVKLETDLA